MKINKPLDKPKGKGVRRFNKWFEKQQKEGLRYVHLSLSIEDDAFFGKRHYMSYFPQWVRNIWSARYINKVLNNYVDIQEHLETNSKPYRDY